MTNLNLKLSPTLVGTTGTGGLYNQPGVWVDAVYFTSSGAQWTTLVANGVASSNAASIALPQIESGKLYFLVSSGASTTTDPLQAVITQQSDINIQSAQQNNYRFDSIEFTLSSSPDDVANLTSVVGFGLPMMLSTKVEGVKYSVGYKVPGSQIFGDIQAIEPSSNSLVYPFVGGPLGGTTDPVDRYGLSPASASQVSDPPSTYDSSYWDAYIDTFKVESTTLLQIAGFFNGAADANGIWHNQGFFNYTMTWDGTYFWLNPESNSQIKGYIQLTPDDLADSIFATNGNAYIYTAPGDATPYTIYNPGTSNPSAEMNTGANNQWGDVLKELLTGFTAGYWGGEGRSLNKKVTTSIDLSQNWNWDPTYAFNTNIVGSTQVTFDPYARIFFQNSNSYGSGYSDNLMSQYQKGGPLLPIAGPNGDVKTINLTIYADSDQTKGYVKPQIYNYIAPPSGTGGQYTAPSSSTTGGTINMALNFALPAGAAGETSWLMDQTQAQVTLNILTGYTGGGAPIWKPLTLEQTQGTDNNGNPVTSLWFNWLVSYDSGTGTYSAAPTPNSLQSSGTLVITGMPIVNGGVTWYQVVVEKTDGSASKTFDLYTTTQADSGVTSSGYGFSVKPGAQAIDGGAQVALGAPSSGHTTDPSLSVNFLSGDSVFIDPSLLVMGPQPGVPPSSTIPMLGQPSSPIAGTVAGSTFTALAQQTYSAPTSISATSSSGSVAFAWVGMAPVTTDGQGNIIGAPANPNYNSSGGLTGDGWDSAYTNKISGLNWANVRVAQGSSVVATTSAQADIDGQWRTNGLPLVNGTYSATMYETTGSSGTGTQVGNASSPLQLTVQASNAAIAVTGTDGDAIGFAAEPDTGSWIEFRRSQRPAGLPSGTTVVMYATDEDGALVGRDGETGPGVTLEEATLAKLGATVSDSGEHLLIADQAVYLLAGQQLHFALLNPDGTIDDSPTLGIRDGHGAALSMNVGGFRFAAVGKSDLAAEVNTATVQRSTDLPLVYLTHGATVGVEVAGSSTDTNTLGFVRVDYDQASDSLSVGGVAYGATEAFYDAVRDALDSGFSVTDGGAIFEQTDTWTVAGASGFYAPVLLSQFGATFVLGDANVDGREHIRLFGQNVFGIESLTAGQGSDFDYNDMVVKLTPPT
jgi:hypothetical protein